MLTDKMRDFIAENNLIPRDVPVGAAVSGGADSMTLLHALKSLGYPVTALHFEHGIRGERSLADMRFVEDYCAREGIPCRCARAEVPRQMRRGESLETAARRLRYDFFAECTRELGLGCVAVAHHADDAAETFLLNLVRGGGMTGLCGMEPARKPNIVRPLLFARRSEIEEYCAQFGIPFVTDETNLSAEFSRNYVRLELIPALNRLNPNAVQSILRTQQLLREENAVLERLTEDALAETAESSAGCVRLALGRLNALEIGLRRRVLRAAIAQVCPLKDIEKQHIDALIRLAEEGGTGRRFELPGKFSANVSYNTLIIVEKVYKIIESGIFPSAQDEPAGRLRETPALRRESREPEDLSQFFDAEELRGAVLRRRLPGDTFRPIGAPGGKKLKDWMIDKKIPSELRGEIPLVACGSRVLWVVGHGVAQDAMVREDTEQIVKLEYLNSDSMNQEES